MKKKKAFIMTQSKMTFHTQNELNKVTLKKSNFNLKKNDVFIFLKEIQIKPIIIPHLILSLDKV